MPRLMKNKGHACLLASFLACVVSGSGLPSVAQTEIGDQGDRLSKSAERTITVARALDKITAQITELELPEHEAVRFGSLIITARHCESRPPEEPPETFAFLEIDEEHDKERRRLFSGWMMASSPALHALEHPVYDVWVIACKTEAPSSPSGNL